MKYKTSLDNLAKTVTIGVTILFIIIIYGQYSLITDEGKSLPIYLAIAFLLIYIITFSLRPISYNCSKDYIVIHRLITDVKIDRKEIKSVELIDKEILRQSFRTFGVGGLFGYFGKFYNSKVGKMTWYATRRYKAILVVTKENKNIIITPDDADGFVSNF